MRRHRDPARFIRENTRLERVPSLPAIRLHAAHQSSRLSRLNETGEDGSEPLPPYWAFAWAGGLALARHLFARPETVKRKRVLDLGSGSGLVAIAAALAGATMVSAAEVDPYGIAAIGLNAEANGVAVEVLGRDILGEPARAADIVLVGDLFYDRALAERVTGFLDRCLGQGIEVLIGDPFRAHLPRERLRIVAEYGVPDVGDAPNAPPTPSAVFALEPAGGRASFKWPCRRR